MDGMKDRLFPLPRREIAKNDLKDTNKWSHATSENIWKQRTLVSDAMCDQLHSFISLPYNDTLSKLKVDLTKLTLLELNIMFCDLSTVSLSETPPLSPFPLRCVLLIQISTNSLKQELCKQVGVKSVLLRSSTSYIPISTFRHLRPRLDVKSVSSMPYGFPAMEKLRHTCWHIWTKFCLEPCMSRRLSRPS